MAVFADLPYETVVEILSLLSCAHLASTIQVSRRFHDISQPLLYTAPCLATTLAPTLPVPSSLGIFLRTLLTPGREALGSQARSLRLNLDDFLPGFKYPDETMVLITAMAAKLGITNPVSTPGAQLMLVLDLLPRLHTLYISPPNARFLESATTLPQGLRSLHTLHYVRTQQIDFVKPRRLLRALGLPCLQELHVPSISRYSIPLAAMAAAIGTSPLTRLRVSHAAVSPAVLLHVLAVPIALTHFSYTAASRCSFDLPRFMHALRPLRTSLVCLRLDFCGLGLMTEAEGTPDGVPYVEGSLREWAVLRTLCCSLVPLLGRMKDEGSSRLVDVLPMGLRELQVLLDWNWGVEEVVEQVVEVLAQRWVVPRLEKLAVGMEWGGTQRSVDRLVGACEAAGVSFVEEVSCW